MTKYGILMTVLLCLVTACSPASVQNSTSDRQELIEKVLEFAISEEGAPDLNYMSEKKNLVLSTKHLFAHERPEIEGLSFVFLTQDEIQEKANREGDFLYLEFQSMNIEGNKAVISLENRWSVSEQSQENGLGYLSGGGVELTFHKRKGDWVMEGVSKQWIS